MKKLTLLLAMLLCLVPVLGSCGAQSSAEKLAVAAFEATYIDFDYDKLYDITASLNLELQEDFLEGDELKAAKESVRSSQDSVKEFCKEASKEVEDYEDFDVEYDVRYVNVYDEKDDKFDDIVNSSRFNDTDFEDEIDEVAEVRIVGEVYITNEDGEESIEDLDISYTCYRIDGSWYLS